MTIPFLKPTLPSIERWQKHLEKAYEINWFSNGGVLVQEFERSLQNYLKTDKEIVVVSNATIGLQLALKALEIKKPVLIPSFTFAATAGAVSWCSLPFEYVDIDDTWCMDPQQAERMLQSGEYGAIMPVHTLGNPCNIAEFDRLGKKYNVKVIYDAAAAVASSYKNRRVGTYGDIEVFSLHATKCLPVGEGGFLSIKDPEVADRVRKLKNFGFGIDRVAELDGTNAKMPEMMAAMGIEALKDLPQHMRNRRNYVKLYQQLLKGMVKFQPVLSGAEHGWQILNVLLDTDATPVIEEMANKSIQVRQYFSPLHLYPAYKREVDLPKTIDIAKRVISLPLYSMMENYTIEIVCKTLGNII